MDLKSPWFSIWLYPRETLRTIFKTDPKKDFWWLCAIYGFILILNSKVKGMMVLFFFFLSPFLGYLMISFFELALFNDRKSF